MRTRSLPVGAAIALAISLLTALPASAAIDVQSITFPGNESEFYSPFDGPATITFSFAGGENNATFNVRLRPAGGTAVYQEDVFVSPDEPEMVEVETVSWPALTVNSPKEYVVSVHRNGTQIESNSFFLHPRLATITDVSPDPFFPWRDDGYRDTTRVRFSLAADASAEARVFKANGAGNCCGSLILDDPLGGLSAGSNAWDWDGRGEGTFAGLMPKGNYYVKIWADDSTLPPAISKPSRVAIARTYRATDTRSKAGTAYHHTTESALVRGGDCFVHNQGGFLQVDCHGARMTVFYRWGLGSAQRIVKASFVIDDPNNDCSPAQRNPGHSKHESFLTVTDSVSGITSCHIVTARITYSYLKAS